MYLYNARYRFLGLFVVIVLDVPVQSSINTNVCCLVGCLIRTVWTQAVVGVSYVCVLSTKLYNVLSCTVTEHCAQIYWYRILYMVDLSWNSVTEQGTVTELYTAVLSQNCTQLYYHRTVQSCTITELYTAVLSQNTVHSCTVIELYTAALSQNTVHSCTITELYTDVLSQNCTQLYCHRTVHSCTITELYTAVLL